MKPKVIWALIAAGVAGAFIFLAVQLFAFAQGVLSAVPSALQSVDRAVVTAFFLQAAVIGVIAMALIQVVRGIYPVRGLYHRRAVREWLGTSASFDSLIRLAVNPKESERLALTLFDLPIEQLCGQIDFPSREYFTTRALP